MIIGIEKLELRKKHIEIMRKEKEKIKNMTEEERFTYFAEKNKSKIEYPTYQQYKRHQYYLEKRDEKWKNLYT